MTDASGNSLAAGLEETRADCNKLPVPNRNGCGLLQARPAAQGLTQGSLRSPLARAGQGQERPPPHLPWLHPSPLLPVVTSGASRSRPGSSPSPASPVVAPLLITCSALNRCSAGCSCVEAPGRPQGRAGQDVNGIARAGIATDKWPSTMVMLSSSRHRSNGSSAPVERRRGLVVWSP